jgi:hypothetical protein
MLKVKDGDGFAIEVEKAKITFTIDGHVVVQRDDEPNLIVSMIDGTVEMVWEDESEVEDDLLTCGIDYSPEDEPGHYICDEPVDDRWPHCMMCHTHHKADASCIEVEAMRAADEQLLRYANG